jgi:hypothetical protein
MSYAFENEGVAGRSSARRVPRLMDEVRRSLRLKHYSWRTEQAYCGWMRRFILRTASDVRVCWAGRRWGTRRTGEAALEAHPAMPCDGTPIHASLQPSIRSRRYILFHRHPTGTAAEVVDGKCRCVGLARRASASMARVIEPPLSTSIHDECEGRYSAKAPTQHK